MKKVTHIIINSIFANRYVNYTKTKFSNLDHRFYLISNKDGKYGKLVDYNGVKYIDHFWKLFYDKKFKQDIRDSDRIVVSGLFGINFVMFFWPTSILNKTCIVFWGGDYTFWKLGKKNIYTCLDYFTKKVLLKKIHSIDINEDEVEELESIFNIKIKKAYHCALPFDPLQNIEYEKYFNNKNDKPVIMIGHSASTDIDHKKSLDVISKFCNEKIKVSIPLSYGSRDLAYNVIDYAKSIFGNKIEPILDYMTYEKYCEYLGNIDIAIIYSYRQIALGNIYALLQMGKKLYFNKKSYLYKHFKNMGCVVYDADEIINESYDDFVNFDYKNKQKNLMAINRFLSNIDSSWKNFYSEI